MIGIDWKQHLKRILSMVLSFSIVLYLLDWVFHLLFHSSRQPLSSILTQGLIFGALMGFFMPFFMRRMVKKMYPTLAQAEEIEYQSPANMFKGVEAVGGMLFITNQGLVFKAHKANIQKGQTNIAFAYIEKIEAVKTAKLVDNGLEVIKKDGSDVQFVVEDRDELIAIINEKL